MEVVASKYRGFRRTLRCLTMGPVIARPAVNGGIRYSSVRQLFHPPAEPGEIGQTPSIRAPSRFGPHSSGRSIASRQFGLDRLHLNLLAAWRTNIAAPDLVDPVDRQAAEEVGILDVLGRRLAGVGALVDGHQTHQPHQALHPFAVDGKALGGQPRRHAARPVEGARQVLAVDQLHQPEIVRADRSRAAVDRGPADLQQVALAADGQGGMRAVDHGATPGPASLPSLLAKKSFSTFSWPIWR